MIRAAWWLGCGVAVLLSGPTRAQQPRPDEPRPPPQAGSGDRSRSFSGFADWDSRSGGYDRSRRTDADDRKPDDRKPDDRRGRDTDRRSDDRRGGPPPGFGGFGGGGAVGVGGIAGPGRGPAGAGARGDDRGSTSRDRPAVGGFGGAGVFGGLGGGGSVGPGRPSPRGDDHGNRINLNEPDTSALRRKLMDVLGDRGAVNAVMAWRDASRERRRETTRPTPSRRDSDWRRPPARTSDWRNSQDRDVSRGRERFDGPRGRAPMSRFGGDRRGFGQPHHRGPAPMRHGFGPPGRHQRHGGHHRFGPPPGRGSFGRRPPAFAGRGFGFGPPSRRGHGGWGGFGQRAGWGTSSRFGGSQWGGYGWYDGPPSHRVRSW